MSSQKEKIDPIDLEKKERDKRFKSRSKKRKEIKDGLLEQLEDKELIEPHFTDLVEDYMALWDIKSELIHDIKIKGVSVMYQNGANQFGYKKNDSVPELTKVNGQMLKLLNELGLKASPSEGGDNDKFEL